MSQNDNIVCTLATDSDKTQWDAFVFQYSGATPYHLYAWISAVKNAYKHNSHSVIARNKQTQAIVGLLPIIGIKTPIKGQSLCALPFCDLGQPLAQDENTMQALLAFSSGLSQSLKAPLEIRNLADSTPEDEALTGKKVRMVMSLPENAEVLLASFKSKLRSQIKKAEKNGLTFKIASGESLVSDFYKVYSANMRDLGSPPHHIDFYHAIMQNYGDNAVISVVCTDDVAIGAGLVLKTQQSACIPWASTLQSYNKLAPNMLLYWSLLAHCADAGMQDFDFGRSTFNEGTYRFKKQWGAKPQLLNWQDFNKQGEPIENTNENATAHPLRSKLEAIWRKLPLPLTVKVGALVRPYISL